MESNQINQNIPDNILELIETKASGKISSDEASVLNKWLQQHPQFQQEYESLLKMVLTLKAIKLGSEINQQAAWEKINRHTIIKSNRKRYLYKALPYAAAGIIVLAFTWYFTFLKQTTPVQELVIEQQIVPERHQKATLVLSDGRQMQLDQQQATSVEEQDGFTIENKPGEMLAYSEDGNLMNEYRMNKLIIPAGARYQVKLSDGTMIWLNSVSELEYPVVFSKNERKVKLSGEAFFEVSPDNKRPFIVDVNGTLVTVLGTSFNISSYKDDRFFETTLVSGSVKITGNNGASQSISPGEQLRLNMETQEIEVGKVDTRFYTSWREGILHFSRVSLNDLAQKLSRWYDVEIVFENEKAARLVFSGAIENSRKIDFLLDLIAQSSGVQYEIKSDKIVIK